MRSSGTTPHQCQWSRVFSLHEPIPALDALASCTSCEPAKCGGSPAAQPRRSRGAVAGVTAIGHRGDRGGASRKRSVALCEVCPGGARNVGALASAHRAARGARARGTSGDALGGGGCGARCDARAAMVRARRNRAVVADRALTWVGCGERRSRARELCSRCAVGPGKTCSESHGFGSTWHYVPVLIERANNSARKRTNDVHTDLQIDTISDTIGVVGDTPEEGCEAKIFPSLPPVDNRSRGADPCRKLSPGVGRKRWKAGGKLHWCNYIMLWSAEVWFTRCSASG